MSWKPSIPAWTDVDAKHPTSGPNIDALDGVRGLAVLIVVASHTHGFGLRGQGGVGVWLFFCLSAFLLTLPAARAPERLRDRASLMRWARRRIGRILPLYYSVLTVWFLFGSARLDRYLRHLLFVQADNHFWTIPQELGFYLVLPFVALLHPIVCRGDFRLTLALLTVGAVVANLWIDFRSFAIGIFLVGVIFSYLATWPAAAEWLRGRRQRWMLEGLAWAGLASIVLTSPEWLARLAPELRPIDARPLSRLHPGSYAVVCGTVIFAATVCRKGFLQKFFSWRPLRSMGLVSYSVYLLSPFVTKALILEGMVPGETLFLATTVITYAIALASYSWIERPFVLVGRRA